MQLTFDSIQELDAFLSWAGDCRGHILTEPAVAGVSGGIQLCTGEVAFDTPPCAGENCDAPAAEHSTECVTAHERAYTSGDAKTSANPEPTKRKRRTKAEIEADDKAAAEAAATKAQETPADASTAPEGANPFAAAETVVETPANPAAEPEAGDTTVTPFQHLTRAREFIAKHGMPKYNESFAKAGLDANVMGYSAYQRALHMDALAALEAA